MEKIHSMPFNNNGIKLENKNTNKMENPRICGNYTIHSYTASQQRRNLKHILELLGEYKNEETTYQNSWDVAKPMTRKKFIIIYAYLEKEPRFQINDPAFCQKHAKNTRSR